MDVSPSQVRELFASHAPTARIDRGPDTAPLVRADVLAVIDTFIGASEDGYEFDAEDPRVWEAVADHFNQPMTSY